MNDIAEEASVSVWSCLDQIESQLDFKASIVPVHTGVRLEDIIVWEAFCGARTYKCLKWLGTPAGIAEEIKGIRGVRVGAALVQMRPGVLEDATVEVITAGWTCAMD